MRNLRYFVLLCTAFFWGLSVSAQNKVASYHTIQKGETLFRLTQIYQVTAESICALNPGLSAENFQAGKTIAIPAPNGEVEKAKTIEVLESSRPEGVADNCREMYKVKRKETIYSISKKFEITEQELLDANPELKKPGAKLKKNSLICIPYKIVKVVKNVDPENEELFATSVPEVSYYGMMKVALLLPFSSTNKAKEASSTMYYRGFMLAIDSLKNEGVNMDLTICDTGANEEKVDSLLREPALMNADLLFCPQIEQNERKISEFARNRQIRLVLTQPNEVERNPYLFTMNGNNNQLYTAVTEYFMRKFGRNNVNVIIVDMDDEDARSSRGELTSRIRQALTEKNMTYKFLNINSANEDIFKTLESSKQNVLVPNSANLALLRRFMTKWKSIVSNNPKYKITVFGHKEWLSLANELKSSFYTTDTYIYTKVWFNPGNAQSKKLAKNYQHWFRAELPTLMPSVPTIGFDTAYYMIKSLSAYGTALEEHLNDISIRPYQNFIKFERQGEKGGFANTKIAFVHFNTKGLVNVED